MLCQPKLVVAYGVSAVCNLHPRRPGQSSKGQLVAQGHAGMMNCEDTAATSHLAPWVPLCMPGCSLWDEHLMAVQSALSEAERQEIKRSGV